MNEQEKKRLVKAVLGGLVYAVVAQKSESVIKSKVTRQPNSDIAVQLSRTFWSICYILYGYYVVGEKES